MREWARNGRDLKAIAKLSHDTTPFFKGGNPLVSSKHEIGVLVIFVIRVWIEKKKSQGQARPGPAAGLVCSYPHLVGFCGIAFCSLINMDYIQNSVRYCCVWKGGEVVYSYNNNNGEHEIDNLAALCLEMCPPPYHRWYFETTGKRTFGFFMYEGYVYFAIVNASVGNSQVLRFLEKLRDEFRRVGNTKRCLTTLSLQQQLVPVVGRLVASLEDHRGTSYQGEPTPSPCNNTNGDAGSTKSPLLGKPTRHEKKNRLKDHVIGMREIEMEEHRGVLHSNIQGTSASTSSQNLQRKWRRQVQIVLAIDAAVCVVLFVIWLVICHGMDCIR
ncbi:hypothetical protein BUALT_Bualt08G0150000 [Buddleja alternifolia]|uniref:Longin domain-containing protein n=1 Tax=Buddleja alternifolia TaxID=168488 RepID=A0AAV6X835_9LAMI|nr:hypothetical protein BUALT_Bualt08G0150000 [Buddleja alternifolia]